MLPVALAAPLLFGYTTLTVSEAQPRLSNGEFAVLIDVRRQDEWDAGHLELATHIPSLQTTEDTSALAGCETCAIAVYCRSGSRSKAAASVLEAKGFSNIFDVLGVQQWESAGVSLVTTPSEQPTCAGNAAECTWPPGGDSTGDSIIATCCMAMTPTCLACSAQQTVADWCSSNPDHFAASECPDLTDGIDAGIGAQPGAGSTQGPSVGVVVGIVAGAVVASAGLVAVVYMKVYRAKGTSRLATTAKASIASEESNNGKA